MAIAAIYIFCLNRGSALHYWKYLVENKIHVSQIFDLSLTMLLKRKRKMIRSRLILEQQRWYRDTLLRGKNFFLEIKSIGILDVPRKPSYHRASQFPLSTHTDGDIGLKKSGRLRERRGRRREKGIDFFSSARSPISRMFRRRVESSNSGRVICYQFPLSYFPFSFSPPLLHFDEVGDSIQIRSRRSKISAISVTELET